MTPPTLVDSETITPEPLAEAWFHSYLELLHRLQLYTEAAEIIKQCPLGIINSRSTVR